MAEERLWLEAKVNDKPVHLAFDTGASELILLPKAVEQLGLSWTNVPKEGSASPGEARVAGITEECDLRLSSDPDRTFRTRFHIIDLPAMLQTKMDGVLGWGPVRNSKGIVLIDAGRETATSLASLPGDVTNWTKFKVDTNSGVLRLAPLKPSKSTPTIFIDTGSEHGVGLPHERWQEWKALHTNQPTTLTASYSPATGLVVAEESWAKRLAVGELVLTNVPVEEAATAETAPGPVVLGLAALRTLELVVDNQKGVAYIRATGRTPPAYQHNRLGAVFVPVNLQGQELIARVLRDSPAWQAGIRDGDVLCRIGDLDVTRWRTDPTVMPLSRFWARPAGTELKLGLTRQGKSFETGVVLRQILPPASTSVSQAAQASRGAAAAQPVDVLSVLLANEVKELKAAAEKGDATSQFELGVTCFKGEGVPQDYSAAVKWLRKAATQGHPQAQCNLGFCYGNGYGVEKNAAEAVKWYRLAAEQDHAQAQCNLAACYLIGQGVAEDGNEAIRWFGKAAAHNYAQAQLNLGTFYYQGKCVKRDYVAAVRWFSKAAEQNLARAQTSLGLCYAQGQGVKQDYEAAVKWYRMAAEQGDAEAQDRLGSCFYNGQGVPRDYTQAVNWCRLAAEQNRASAQNNVGIGYANGQGVPKDGKEALKWFTRAAAQNYTDAYYNLGICYRDGFGVARDPGEAVKWFRKAAELNHGAAQFNLGSCLANGLGVTQDYVDAYKWLRLASAQGVEPARRNLDKLTSVMTPEQIVEGWRRVRSFKPADGKKEPAATTDASAAFNSETNRASEAAGSHR